MGTVGAKKTRAPIPIFCRLVTTLVTCELVTLHFRMGGEETAVEGAAVQAPTGTGFTFPLCPATLGGSGHRLSLPRSSDAGKRKPAQVHPIRLGTQKILWGEKTAPSRSGKR